MEDVKKFGKEELRELANKGWGALSWIKLSRTIREEIRKNREGNILLITLVVDTNGRDFGITTGRRYSKT